MATLAEDIRSAIVGSTEITSVFSGATAVGAVEHATVRENPPSPRIWYIRDNENEDLDLANDGGLVRSQWSLEVHSDSDATAIAIADAVKSKLHGLIGTLGGREALSVKVEDHDDEYIPRGDASEDGLFVAAVKMTIWHDST